jgi:N-acetylmuramoyl-L-alanine amidase
VRELHELLLHVGNALLTKSLNTFDDGTLTAVEAFQRTRGLPITGVVDLTTWTRLVEASWQPGQRLLFLTRPYMRGDDVADLQVHLAQLGFNPGRIDGIFGPVLEHALIDFQRNCAISADGTLTRATLRELRRLTMTSSNRNLVNDARDLAGFGDVASGPLVLCGQSPLTGLLASAAASAFDVHDLTANFDDEITRFANAQGATAVLSIQEVSSLNVIQLHYWSSYRAHSRLGEQLASSLATYLSRSEHLPAVEVTGMALPIMRETTMTTLRIEHGTLTQDALSEFSAACVEILSEVFHR